MGAVIASSKYSFIIDSSPILQALRKKLVFFNLRLGSIISVEANLFGGGVIYVGVVVVRFMKYVVSNHFTSYNCVWQFQSELD